MISFTHKWTFKEKAPIMGLELGLSSEDKPFLLAYTKSGIISIFSLDGNLLFQDGVSDNQPIWQAKLTKVHDSSENFLIIGSSDGLLRIFNVESSFTLNSIWAHQFGASVSGILLSDINDNGHLEIIAYSIDKSIRVLDLEDGSLIWGQIFEEGIGDAVVLEGDKPQNKELIACGNDGTIRIFRGTDGELLWFKKYSDKIRFVSNLHSEMQDYIICGGDDKKLHIINRITDEESKTIDFNNYVWKCITFPPQENTNILVSSYSFAFFDESIPIEDLQFNSKLICINNQLETIWEVKNINIETLKYIETLKGNFICFGTTKGELILLNEKTGQILFSLKQKSALNDIKFEPNSQLLFACHDDGHLYAYFLGNL